LFSGRAATSLWDCGMVSIARRLTTRGVVYDVRLRRPGGREYSRTFRTLREAKAFDAAQRTAHNRGDWIDPTGARTLFSDWAWTWPDNDQAKSPGARSTDASIIRSALVPVFGERTLGSIRPLDVQSLVAAWCREVKPRTVRRRYATLAAIFRAAVDSDLIARSPCRSVHLPAPEPATGQIVSTEEFARLVEQLPSQYRPMVYLGALLGLRLGEVAGLRVGRIDFDRQTLTVAESVGEASGRLFGKGPKSAAGRRTLPLPRILADVLAQHIAARELADPSAAYLFTAPNGGPLRPPHFRSRVWRPACARAGLAGLGFHDLRRSSATVMVASGVSVRDAQQILGHTDPRLTLSIYAQATETGMRIATESTASHFLAALEAPNTHGRTRTCTDAG